MLLGALFEIIFFFILIGGGYFGYRKGLFKLAVAPIRMLICLGIACVMSRWVGDELVSPLVFPAVRNYFSELLQQTESYVSNSLPTLLKIITELSAFGGAEDGWLAAEQFIELLAYHLSYAVSRIIAFVVLFIALGIALRFLIHLIDAILGKGIPARINALLGVIPAICLSAVLVWCLVSVLDCLQRLDCFSSGDFVGGPLFRLFGEVGLFQQLLGF